MTKTFILVLTIILAGSSYVAAQFPQMEKGRQRMEASEKASKEKSDKDAAGTQYPPAVMNVDVQMVLATRDLKSFAEAKPLAVSRIVDGDPLWLYIKFNGTLERYVYPIQSANGKQRYALFVEIGPQGDITAKNHYILHFEKEDLSLTELKLSLSPGAAGHLRSMPVFLRSVANLRPGVWNNEIRLTNLPALPRGPTNHLAKVSIAYDLSKGLTKYPKMVSDYKSMMLRGTADTSKLPLSAKFDSTTLRGEITAKITTEGIKPLKLYFGGDGWSEYSDEPMSLRQERTVFAAFTYTRGKDCLYGIAEVVQKYDPALDHYGSSTITLQKDIPAPCAEIQKP